MKKLILLAALISFSAFAGRPITQIQNNFATTSYTTSAWGTIVSSLSRESAYVDVYSSSTAGTIILGIGAVGSEYNALYLQPNSARVIPLRIPKNSRVSLKALNGTVITGEMILNFLE